MLIQVETMVNSKFLVEAEVIRNLGSAVQSEHPDGLAPIVPSRSTKHFPQLLISLLLSSVDKDGSFSSRTLRAFLESHIMESHSHIHIDTAHILDGTNNETSTAGSNFLSSR